MLKRIIGFSFALLIGGAAAFGGHPKIAKDLERVDPASNVDVIIQYKQAPTAAHHQKVHAKGGQHKRDVSVIKGGHYSMRASELAGLANDPDVVAISPDRVVTGALDLAIQAINATIAQANNYNGTGVGVAVIDSGVDAPDLAAQSSTRRTSSPAHRMRWIITATARV